MSEFYDYPPNCISCGSDNLRLRYNPDNKTNIIRIECMDCNARWSPSKIENLNRRTNTALTKWAYAVKNRYNNTCVICGSQENVEAHHIIPVAYCKNSGIPEMMHLIHERNNGIALCKKHHSMAHEMVTTD